VAGCTIQAADNFTFHDPADNSIRHNQGSWLTTVGGGRIVYACQAPAPVVPSCAPIWNSMSANPALHFQTPSTVLAPLSRMARTLAWLENHGITTPTAVT